jgi:hypothetical protein
MHSILRAFDAFEARKNGLTFAAEVNEFFQRRSKCNEKSEPILASAFRI